MPQGKWQRADLTRASDSLVEDDWCLIDGFLRLAPCVAISGSAVPRATLLVDLHRPKPAPSLRSAGRLVDARDGFEPLVD